MKKLALIFCLMLPLTGCDVASGGKPLARMTFEHVKPFPLYVASYDVQEEWTPQANDPPAGQFVARPGRAVADYFRNRYKASGTNGKFIAIVESAGVAHDMQESGNAVGAFLGVDRQDVYHMAVTVRMIAYDAGGFDQKEMKITARRDVSVSEHVSLVEREKAQMDALDTLIDDLDIAVRNALAGEFHLMR